MANKANSLAHTKWVCEYHIVFTPKYRRKIIYNQYKECIRDIIKQLCAYKGVEMIEGHLIAGSYPHVSEHSAKDKCVVIYGISKRQECIDDIR